MHALSPPSPEDHHLSLRGATLRPTRATRLTAAHLKTVIKANGMMCIHGAVGLGKTLAVNTNLYDLAAHTTLRFQYPPGYPLNDFRADLAEALELPEDLQPGHRTTQRLIKSTLAAQPRIIVLDEAQTLSNLILEYIRDLWADKQTHLAVVFVGGENCYQRIRSRAALASRICLWQQYAPLRPDEVVDTMPNYHPVWADVSPQDLLWVNDLACHGNFRNWATLTFHLQEAIDDPDREDSSFSRKLARAVLADMDSTDRSYNDHHNSSGYM
ncbi:AAA family ATPase [Streptomyces sp. NBC_00887]|uniref:AAA family ATPase n=1 Tax=Streptomyces sp. NBC_00887 TaxID=2975859 RepID=UPI003870B4B3|nr:ATP-binding protein [Streptomyces sp. NBC_00887]WSY36192.1 ATP-binding protein [Streptomyces sp. NBC_00887]